jgi:hypothetical protein
MITPRDIKKENKGLAEIKEEDEQSEAAGEVLEKRRSIRENKRKSPIIGGKKFDGGNKLLSGKLKGNKMESDAFWNLDQPGGDAEEEKELESAINIGSETGANTLTRLHTKVTDNVTRIGTINNNNRLSSENLDLSNNLNKKKDPNNESNGSWADLLRENEKEVEKELNNSKENIQDNKIMSAIDITDRESLNFKKNLLVPAINLDRRESSSENPITSKESIPGLHPDLLLQASPRPAIKKAGQRDKVRLSLRLPMASRRFDSPSLDTGIGSNQDQMLKTGGFKKPGQSAFNK